MNAEHPSLTNPSKSRPKILCAGIAVEDILMRVEHFPAPGTKVSASDYVTVGGGCAANAEAGGASSDRDLCRASHPAATSASGRFLSMYSA